MTELFKLYVNVYDNISVDGGEKVNLALFNGNAVGEYFNGTVLRGGVDTQSTDKSGKMSLSARYILEGTDRNGDDCRIFVENVGDFENGFTPCIVTDSKALAPFMEKKLSTLLNADSGEVVITFLAE